MSSAKSVVVHIIDDDIDVRRGFSRLLRSAGREVRNYRSAESFLASIDSVAPGCILLDVTKPGISVEDMLTRLKDRQDSLPVVVVSGRDNERIRSLVGALGAKMFLRKPVDDQALLDAIDWVTRAEADHK